MHEKFPLEIEFLIIGGGIHGVGVAHDLVSRGLTDVVVLEKDQVGSGTSSKSTKLIHGGLRYLKNLRDFSLVAEGLHERKILLERAPDLVKPLELLFPVMKNSGMPSWMVQAGLFLYDKLAGNSGLKPHQKIALSDFKRDAPIFDTRHMKACFSFWDGQTDDLALTQRVAQSAQKFGAKVFTNSKVAGIKHDGDKWIVTVMRDGEASRIGTKVIVNAGGPWAHEILQSGEVAPEVQGINVKGSHLLCRDLGLRKAVFLQSAEDRRIFFVLPWLGKTLIGTTETIFDGDPDKVATDRDDIAYLLKRTNFYLEHKISEQDIEQTFSGLRWLAGDGISSATQTSRSFVFNSIFRGDAVITTIYGGKLTGYRALSKTLVDSLLTKMKIATVPSRTHEAKFWLAVAEDHFQKNLNERFGGKFKHDQS